METLTKFRGPNMCLAYIFYCKFFHSHNNTIIFEKVNLTCWWKEKHLSFPNRMNFVDIIRSNINTYKWKTNENKFCVHGPNNLCEFYIFFILIFATLYFWKKTSEYFFFELLINILPPFISWKIRFHTKRCYLFLYKTILSSKFSFYS